MGKYINLVCVLGALIACTVSYGNSKLHAHRTAVRSGGSDGGGSDLVQPWIDSAWFVGAQHTVKACFQRSSAFGMSDAEVSQSIYAAYKVWADYFAAKTGALNHTQTIDLPTQVSVSSKCAGNEDLTFYFGVQTPEVTAELQNFNDPISIAHRRNYNTKTWDSGFIWVGDAQAATALLNSDWSTSDLLVGVLVHEIGHSLGNGHVSGTLMREDLIAFLQTAVAKTAPTRHIMLTTVDWEDDLIEMGFNFNFEGQTQPLGDKWGDITFQTLVGRPAASAYVSHLWRTDQDFHLVLTDSTGSYDFTLQNFHNVSGVFRQKTVFKIYDPASGNFPINESMEDVIISMAQIQAADGTMVPVMLQRGGAQLPGAWTLQGFFADGHTDVLFNKLCGGIECFTAP